MIATVFSGTADMTVQRVSNNNIVPQYSILVFNLDLTGKLGESGPNLDIGGVNLDLSDPYLTS